MVGFGSVNMKLSGVVMIGCNIMQGVGRTRIAIRTRLNGRWKTSVTTNERKPIVEGKQAEAVMALLSKHHVIRWVWSRVGHDATACRIIK